MLRGLLRVLSSFLFFPIPWFFAQLIILCLTILAIFCLFVRFVLVCCFTHCVPLLLLTCVLIADLRLRTFPALSIKILSVVDSNKCALTYVEILNASLTLVKLQSHQESGRYLWLSQAFVWLGQQEQPLQQEARLALPGSVVWSRSWSLLSYSWRWRGKTAGENTEIQLLWLMLYSAVVSYSLSLYIYKYPRRKSPRKAAAPRCFGSLVFQLSVGVAWGDGGGRGKGRRQAVILVIQRWKSVLTGDPGFVKLLHALLAHLFTLQSQTKTTAEECRHPLDKAPYYCWGDILHWYQVTLGCPLRGDIL